MSRRLAPIGLALLGIVCAIPAGAEPTHLHLGESATVMAAPDEIVASLRAEAIAGAPAEVQKRVNETIRDALALAQAAPGVTVSTGGYAVWRTQQNGADRWQGGQSLNLTSGDAAVLLKLVGDLQQKGLVTGDLSWRLARETGRTALRKATQMALAALRGRADEAAAQLGLAFGQFADIRLDSAAHGPQPQQFAAPMGMVRAAAAPPAAVAEDIAVTASVEADVVLVPR